MSSSLYQGLQSCLEPQLAEPRILKLKLAHPKSASPIHKYSLECSNKVEAQNGMLTELNSIQNIVITNFEKAPSKETTQVPMEKIYVHPLIKRSASFLSDRSLEMCTENLGSETGSESSSDEIESFALFEEITTDSSGNTDHHESRINKFTSRKKRNLIRSSSFPPPLSSTRDLVHVKPHREGGRLVLKAVSFPHSNALFHAERSHGRLRLRLLKPDNSIKEDGQVSEVEDEERVDDHEEDDEFDDDSSSGFRNMDANNNMEEELVSTRPTTRRRRCKESERTQKQKAGLWDLEPYWVAST